MSLKIIARTLLAAVLVTSLGACGGSEQRKAAYLQRGKDLLAEENYDKAQLEFKNALQIDPNDADARFHLAQVLERQQNWTEAFKHLAKVVQDHPDHVDARTHLGQLYLLSGAPDKARNEADEILKRNPKHADGLTLRAALHTQRGELDAAAADVAAALAAEPDNTRAIAMQSALQVRAGKTNDAIKTLEAAVARLPKASDLKVLLAEMYRQQGRLEDSAKTVAGLVQDKPEQIEYRMRLAALYEAAGKHADADKTMREAIAKFPEDIKPKLDFIRLLMARKDQAGAEKELVAFVAARPDDHPLRMALADFYLQTKRTAEAEKVLEEVIDRAGTEPEGLKARNRLALVKVQAGDKERAGKLVDEVLKENERDVDALVIRSELAYGRNDLPTAIADLRSALRDDPTSSRVLRLLARAHMKNKEPELARDSLAKAADAHPDDLQTQQEYLQLLVARGDVDGAVSHLKKLTERGKPNAQLLQALFQAQAAKKDWAGARATAERLAEFDKRGAIGPYLLGLVDDAEGQPDAAIAKYEAALEKAPDAVEPMVQLVKSLIRNKRMDDAVKRVDTAIAAQPQNPVLLNLAGEMRLLQKKNDEAIGFFDRAVKASPKFTVGYQNLARAYADKGDRKSAAERLSAGAEATGGDPTLVATLAEMFARDGNVKGARETYEAAIKRDPKALWAVNNLAMLLVDTSSSPADLARAGELAEMLKPSREAANIDTVGWVAYRRGDFKAAVESLKRAVEMAPAAGELRYHYGMALLKTGDKEGARTHLAAAIAANQTFRGLDEAKSTLADLGGAPAPATPSAG
ncbi:MAG: tetratricopeptide repeat protein [Gammaproteobacteria bacterium]